MIEIEGQTLPQIWQRMPGPYRVIVVVSCVFLAFSFLYLSTRFIGNMVERATASAAAPLDVMNLSPTVSTLDPSITSDGKGTTAMAFTAFDNKTGELNIAIAQASNGCANWRMAGNAMQSKPEGLLAPDGVTTLAEGTVRYETPSLVYDPSDQAAPWKLFAYRYFWAENNVSFAQRYSMITRRAAAAPTGPWSKEEWILATAPDYPPAPYQALVQQYLHAIHPNLRAYSAFSRPSVVIHRGVMLMSLIAFRNTADADSVVMLASLDRGRKWVYAGTALTRADLPKTGAHTRLAGASLVKEGNQVYLAAVLGDAQVGALGTFIYPFSDVARGVLATGPDGKFALAHHIPRQSTTPTNVGGGYATFDETCAGGVITAEYSGLRNRYQLFKTAQTPTGKD